MVKAKKIVTVPFDHSSIRTVDDSDIRKMDVTQLRDLYMRGLNLADRSAADRELNRREQFGKLKA